MELENKASRMTLNRPGGMTYGYNHVNQRTSTTASDISYLWTPPQSMNVNYDAANNVNQYPAVGGINLSYDGNGNLSSDGSYSYSYDTENRLTAAYAANGMTHYYTYDPFGRRYSKTVSIPSEVAETTYFIHDGSQEIAEYKNGNLSTRYVFSGLDQAVVKITPLGSLGTDYLYAHTDNQGSVVALTDQPRNLRGQVTYDPWGDSSNINTDVFGFGYTGQRFDGETGLYYYKARYYHAQLGRFLSTDPIGYADGLNVYAYVGNDPLNRVDPTGMAWDDAKGMASDAFDVATDVLSDGVDQFFTHSAWDNDTPSDSDVVVQHIDSYYDASNGNIELARDMIDDDRGKRSPTQPGYDLSLRDAGHYYEAYANPSLGFVVPLYSAAKAVGFDYPQASKPTFSEVYWGGKGALDGLIGRKPPTSPSP